MTLLVDVKKCAHCSGAIHSSDAKCRHCGKPQRAMSLMHREDAPARRNASSTGGPRGEARPTTGIPKGISAFLTVVFPGVGHMTQGRVRAGFLWMAVVVAGYFFLGALGVAIHLLALVSVLTHTPDALASMRMRLPDGQASSRNR